MIIKTINADLKVNYNNLNSISPKHKTAPNYSSNVTNPFYFSPAFCGAIKTQALQGVQEKFTPTDRTRLGANYNGNEADFSVAAKNAQKVFLCIFKNPNDDRASMTIPMKRKGDIWKTSVPTNELGGTNTPVYYGYRAFGPNWEYSDDFFNEDGSIKNPKAGFKSIIDEQGNTYNPNKIAFDPYGRELSHLPSDNPKGIPAYFSLDDTFSDNALIAPKSVLVKDKPLPITKGSGRKLIDQVIGEVHMKDLSINEDVKYPGTYLGAAQMAPKIAQSGISMVEFLPLHEFDNKEGYDGNYWGYMTLGFFAPAKKYAHDKTPGGALREFRQMVDAFHKEGVDVCMDVVYNHTGEAGTIGDEKENRKQMSYSLLDNQMYYKQRDGWYNNNTGCGNDINAGSDEVIEMIADSVAFFAKQGVDAFRFDLAVGLMDKDTSSETYYDAYNSAVGKLKEKLEQKGIDVKNPDEEGKGITLIAEPWTCCGNYSYQLGNFPKNWAEWNDKFREFTRLLSTNPNEVAPKDIRYFLEGSKDTFKNTDKSINYVYSHDGHCMFDYNIDKYNGDTKRAEAEMKKQIAMTLLSKGTPMLQIGDIIAHSKGGNSNTYCNDDESNYLDFSRADSLDTIEGRIYDFTKNLIEFRNRHNNNSVNDNYKTTYYKPDGSVVSSSDSSYWANNKANIICYKTQEENPTFVSISTDPNAFEVKLPKPDNGKQWYRVCDTGYSDSCGLKDEVVYDKFISQPYAVAVFEQR